MSNKVNITFKVKFELMVYSNKWSNGFGQWDTEVVSARTILPNRTRYEDFLEFYDEFTMENYDEKYIRKYTYLDALFDRMEHTIEFDMCKKKAISQLENNSTFKELSNRSVMKKGGLTIFGKKIWDGTTSSSLANYMNKYLDERINRNLYGENRVYAKYAGYELIGHIYDYELEYL